MTTPEVSEDWVIQRLRLSDAVDKAEQALADAEAAYDKYMEKACFDELEARGLVSHGFGDRTREQWVAECDRIIKRYKRSHLNIYQQSPRHPRYKPIEMKPVPSPYMSYQPRKPAKKKST